MKWLACLVILALAIGLFWPVDSKPSADPVYLAPVITDPQQGDRDIVQDINRQNSTIRSLYADVVVWSHPIRLRGSIAHEKDKRFRCVLSSLMGKELDLGSNESVFWFWGKRLNPPALYYAKHEDLMKTRLKTPFNPHWMMEILGTGQIDTTNAALVRNNNRLAVCQPRISTLGEKIVKITLIDPQRKVVVGHYIWKNNKIIVSAEIVEFQQINGRSMPKKIKFIWDEEDKAVAEWELTNLIVNGQIKDLWRLPTTNHMINMGVD